MGVKSLLIKPIAKYVSRVNADAFSQAVARQEETFRLLIAQAATTQFGNDHDFASIKSGADFSQRVPVRDYEAFRSYIDQMVAGKADVLWPGLPTYLAKTSGTTSGMKYIPMTKASTPHHVKTARDALFAYVSRTGRSDIFDGEMLYLSGSPELTRTNGIRTGRLSGIVNHQIPNWIKGNKLPSAAINAIDDWETKVNAIADESLGKDLRLIGGIPPWVQMYYECVLEKTGAKTITDVFPNLTVFIYGGVNFSPYRSQLNALVGKELDTVETYPASEGFIAYQDGHEQEGMILNTEAGIYYEFVVSDQISEANPERLTLGQVELGKNYAIVLTTNAGLWAYNIGDTVEFVSLDPYRLRVTGRIKHFISAFGEHVIAKEVERAMQVAADQLHLQINEFTVAPQVNPIEGLPYHEWFLATDDPPAQPEAFAKILDQSMQEQNVYYRDLIQGNILRPARVTILPGDAFRRYMESQGKLGGQNKVPRLSNDRNIADQLMELRKY